ncbi:MAG: lysophospholipid acyltransferase family protein [Epsilonproteobacteria bacterium]|nr:lysophospholipid acyltransferase family protein [Campylobacterota bacterium]
MKDKIEYAFAKILIFLVKFLPNFLVYKIMKLLAKIVFKFEKRRSHLTKINLKAAFKNLSEDKIVKLAQSAYDSLAITVAEIIMMLNDKVDLNQMVTNKDEFLAKIQHYTQNTHNGILLITAHFSNWELAAAFMALNGYPITVVGREGNNKLIEKNITTPFREKYGNKNIYKKKAMINIIKAIKNGQSVGLMIDQKAGGTNSVKSKFFGMDADTISSVAVLKLKYNPLVLPVFAIRNSDGTYKIEVLEPVEYKAEEENGKDKKIEKMTQKYNDILEEIIRKYPEQWFWMHNRWRLV